MIATAQPTANQNKSTANSAVANTIAASEPLNPTDFQVELQRLDAICSQLKLQEEQRLMSDWIVSQASDSHLLFLPVAADPLEVAANSTTASAHASWLKHFTTARNRHAQYWFDTAKKQIEAGDEWAAYRSLWRAAREDSSHTETKRALAPLLAALNVKGKPRLVTIVHPQFQWASGTYSRMETANFKITSRSSVAETQRIAAQLETFYALWTQAFYPLWAAPGVTAQRLSGRNVNWQRRQQFDVVLCKDRDDYLKTLGIAESNISISVGYYNPESEMSYFYPDENLDATLYHELTHQLLAEASQLKGSQPKGSQLNGSQGVGEKNGIWLVEAAALYMESLRPAAHHWRLGGWLAPRLQAARYRAVHDGYWLEPTELDALSLAQWKEREDLARLYAHSAGLAHFFMDRRLPRLDSEMELADRASASTESVAASQAAEKRLDQFDSEDARATFFSALIAVYRGDTPPEKFWLVAGKEHAQQDYLHFLLVRDRQIQSEKVASSAAPISELVLTRSRLTPESWQAVGQFSNLTWLDVSHSNAKARDLDWLKNMQRLERLSLEGTEVDSQLMTAIAQLPVLEELDLSATNISDEMLATLKQCGSLETLWLSGTQVTSASLSLIEKLPKLKFVALDETLVKPGEANELNEKLKNRVQKK